MKPPSRAAPLVSTAAAEEVGVEASLSAEVSTPAAAVVLSPEAEVFSGFSAVVVASPEPPFPPRAAVAQTGTAVAYWLSSGHSDSADLISSSFLLYHERI